jgi:3-oxoacyl-[acyl-carrier-protein] synthase-1
MIYIGAENIISPLGNTANENFENLRNNISGIQLHQKIGFDKKDLYLSKINTDQFNSFLMKFDALLIESIKDSLSQIDSTVIDPADLIVIISSTKGNIDKLNNANEEYSLVNSAKAIQAHFNFHHTPLVISNACISGVMAINTANNLIETGKYKHAIVVGADIISEFVLWGFQSLFAISDTICKPFDKDRKGITMGEGAGSVFISNDKSIYKEKPLQLLAGVSTNDANHISGPSRTGEGLFRAIKKTQEKNNIKTKDIDFISAHGTATNYNDERESIAFSRLEMLDIPLNSLKGYYGHTLGAAGMIESIISMQSIRTNTLIQSLGFENQGTTHKLNILTENKEQKVNCILKTASGFGGCNAALIIKE